MTTRGFVLECPHCKERIVVFVTTTECPDCDEDLDLSKIDFHQGYEDQFPSRGQKRAKRR